MAIGESTNMALHIPHSERFWDKDGPIHLRPGVQRGPTHNIPCPGGIYYMSDFERAGGVPSVLKRLRSSLSDEDDALCKTIYEIADEAVIEDRVIRNIDEPFHKEGGIAILYVIWRRTVGRKTGSRFS